HAVSAAGDVNGDGYDDILIGAFFNDEGGDNAGQIYLIFSNAAPSFGPVPVLKAVEDVPITYDFSGNVSDPDTPLGDLILTSPSPYVTSIDGLNVTFEFPNGVLTATVPLNLSDGNLLATGVVNFTIQPVNDPPTYSPALEDQSATQCVPWTFDLYILHYIWDIDNGKMDLSLIVDSPYATVTGLTLTMLFPEGMVEYDLWLNISDGIDTTEVKIHFRIYRGPPDAPRTLAATPGDGYVDLEWHQPFYLGRSYLLGYRILRGLTPNALSLIDENSAYNRTYRDLNVTNGVTYHYAVRAFNSLGDSAFSNIDSAKPVGLPGVPMTFRVTPSNMSVILNWDPPDVNGGEPIERYLIFRGGTKDNLTEIMNVTEISFVDKDVANGQTYWYRVRARTLVGIGPGTAALGATPMGPPIPPIIKMYGSRLNAIYLAWHETEDNGGSPVTGYRIYRGESRSALEPHDQVSLYYTDFLDTELTANITYFYAVATITEFTEGEMSTAISCFAYGLPSAPVDFVASAG
ncbi:MAG: FG-GAP repeat protein, partial [Thermoplasmata archaeon]|nr:FG-GAP repeat protein [Thermoplasmata archaeon]